MKKFDNFINSFNVLMSVNCNAVNTDEIYPTGVIGQFNFTFKLAWKALREVLELSGVSADRLSERCFKAWL